MPWDAIRYVGSAASLAAIVAAVGGWMCAVFLANRRRLIQGTKDQRQADLVARTLETFNIDAATLSQSQ